MRLLKRSDEGDLSLTEALPDQDLPKYAVLSHTWGAPGQEVTLQEFQNLSPEERTGKRYEKIQFCGDRAAHDGMSTSGLIPAASRNDTSTGLSPSILDLPKAHFRFHT